MNANDATEAHVLIDKKRTTNKKEWTAHGMDNINKNNETEKQHIKRQCRRHKCEAEIKGKSAVSYCCLRITYVPALCVCVCMFFLVISVGHVCRFDESINLFSLFKYLKIRAHTHRQNK